VGIGGGVVAGLEWCGIGGARLGCACGGAAYGFGDGAYAGAYGAGGGDA
jgi:hypothetical protein